MFKVEGSNDKTAQALLQLHDNFQFYNCSASKNIIFEINQQYKYYSIIFKKRSDSNMSIGHVGLTQSYLFEYAKELFEELTGSQVLDPT